MRNPWNGGGRCPSTPGVSWGRSGIAALSGGALDALKVLEATGGTSKISTTKVRLVGTRPWTSSFSALVNLANFGSGRGKRRVGYGRLVLRANVAPNCPSGTYRTGTSQESPLESPL